jgi:hypothetical protein
MPGLSHLRDVYDKRGKDFLEGLLNKTVIVNEKMDGAFFGAQKNEETGEFRFFKRNAEITYIDRVLSRYYEPAIRHFENLGDDVVSQVPSNYHFGMEWFTSPKAQTIAYDRLPKNGLILSYIHILDDNGTVEETIQDKATLDSWADLLEIERPPIVFQGKLSPEQREKIQEFIYAPFDELVGRFKTTSFTRYIMSVLNPEMESTFLRDTLDKDIEGLVFRFYDPEATTEESVFLAKLVDPVFQERAKSKAQERVQKKSDDYIWIIAIDLTNFIERYSISELRDVELKGSTYEQRYISLINKIYLDFIAEFGDKYSDLDIQIPEFLTREEFGVNFNLIKNPSVTKVIESNPNFKEIYRILLNIFRKKKIRVNSSLFTKPMRDNLNSQIDKISKVIMGDTVFENYFPTFNEFVGTNDEPGYFETFAKVPEADRKVKRVNVIVSDFQPIHHGHIKSAKKLFESNGFPCLLVCVHQGTASKMKPISQSTMAACLSKIANENPEFIAGHRMINDDDVRSVLTASKPEFEPAVISGTKSRIKDIAMQMELAKKRSRDLNFKKDLKLIELPTSLTKSDILDSIKNGDYERFKANSPTAIHSEFFNLNREVSERLNESAVPQEQPDQAIKELIDLIPSLDQELVKAFLKKARQNFKTSVKTVREILQEKGLPPNSAKAIVHDLREFDEENEFIQYMENQTVTVSELRSKTSLTDLFSEIKLSDGLKKEIISMVDSRGNTQLGPGEIPIAIFVKDARINTDTNINGDVLVGDLILEVKMSSELNKKGVPESGAQLASANYSSRATKAQLFKTQSGRDLVAKYGLDVAKLVSWPNMLASTSPSTDPEAKDLAFKFLQEQYPGLFESPDQIDWTNGITINRSVGLALGVDYLKTLGENKILMYIATDRNTYKFFESIEVFKQAVESGEFEFKMASDMVPRCNLRVPGQGIKVEEAYDEDLYDEDEA